MKHTIFYFILLFSLPFAGCKKDFSSTMTNNETILKVNSWLDAQKTGMQKFKADNIDLLKLNLDFKNLKIEELPDGNEIIIVPISDNFKQQKINDKNSIPNLVLLANNSGNIRNGNVVLFKPDIEGQYSKVPSNTFHDIYVMAKVKSNGVFQFLTPAGQWQYQLTYKNDNLETFKKLKPNTNPASETRTSTICVDWYWVTTYYYSDGSSETTREYLGTTCSEECGDGTYASLCPDGSSSGGGFMNDVLIQATTIEGDSNTPTMIFGSEVTDPNTGKITRNVGYEWQCGHGSTIVLGSFYNWIYMSYETGGEYKNSDGHWKLESLTHSSIQRIGITPPTHNYTIGLGNAYSNLDSDGTSGHMTLRYVVYETIQSGLPFPQINSWQINTGVTCLAE